MKNIKFTATFDTVTEYIQQNADILITTAVGASDLAPYVNFVGDMALGYKREIPLIDTTWTMKGGTCSTYANGGTVATSGAELAAKIILFEQDLCSEAMRKYFYGQYQSPDIMDRQIPFEEAFLAHGMKRIGKQINELFWQGGTVDGQTIDGMIDLADAAGATGITASSFAVSTAFNNGILATIDNMANQLSGDMLGEEDLYLYLGTKEMLAYAQSLRNVNNFHLDPRTIDLKGAFVYSHPNIKIIPQIGLSGEGKALLSKKDYILYGADVNPESKNFETHNDFYTRKQIYRYVSVFASAVMPVGGNIIIATSGDSF